MVHLTIEGYTIDLQDSVILTNETLSDSDPAASHFPYTYTFQVPVNYDTTRVLGTPLALQLYNDKRINASLSTTGFNLDGYIKITEATPTVYKCEFHGRTGKVAEIKGYKFEDRIVMPVRQEWSPKNLYKNNAVAVFEISNPDDYNKMCYLRTALPWGAKYEGDNILVCGTENQKSQPYTCLFHTNNLQWKYTPESWYYPMDHRYSNVKDIPVEFLPVYISFEDICYMLGVECPDRYKKYHYCLGRADEMGFAFFINDEYPPLREIFKNIPTIFKVFSDICRFLGVSILVHEDRIEIADRWSEEDTLDNMEVTSLCPHGYVEEVLKVEFKDSDDVLSTTSKEFSGKNMWDYEFGGNYVEPSTKVLNKSDLKFIPDLFSYCFTYNMPGFPPVVKEEWEWYPDDLPEDPYAEGALSCRAVMFDKGGDWISPAGSIGVLKSISFPDGLMFTAVNQEAVTVDGTGKEVSIGGTRMAVCVDDIARASEQDHWEWTVEKEVKDPETGETKVVVDFVAAAARIKCHEFVCTLMYNTDDKKYYNEVVPSTPSLFTGQVSGVSDDYTPTGYDKLFALVNDKEATLGNIKWNGCAAKKVKAKIPATLSLISAIKDGSIFCKVFNYKGVSVYPTKASVDLSTSNVINLEAFTSVMRPDVHVGGDKVRLTLLKEGEGDLIGAGMYEIGTRVVCQARPAEGWKFDRWSNGSINNIIAVDMYADTTLTATFVQIPEGQVEVKVSGSYCTTSGSGIYDAGAEVEISCQPIEGYHFKTWTDLSLDNPRTIIASNKEYIAVCVRDTVPVQFDLDVTVTKCRADVEIDGLPTSVYADHEAKTYTIDSHPFTLHFDQSVRWTLQIDGVAIKDGHGTEVYIVEAWDARERIIVTATELD